MIDFYFGSFRALIVLETEHPPRHTTTIINAHNFPPRRLLSTDNAKHELQSKIRRAEANVKRTTCLTNAGAKARERHIANWTKPLVVPNADGLGVFSFTSIMLTLQTKAISLQ